MRHVLWSPKHSPYCKQPSSSSVPSPSCFLSGRLQWEPSTFDHANPRIGLPPRLWFPVFPASPHHPPGLWFPPLPHKSDTIAFQVTETRSLAPTYNHLIAFLFPSLSVFFFFLLIIQLWLDGTSNNLSSNPNVQGKSSLSWLMEIGKGIPFPSGMREGKLGWMRLVFFGFLANWDQVSSQKV